MTRQNWRHQPADRMKERKPLGICPISNVSRAAFVALFMTIGFVTTIVAKADEVSISLNGEALKRSDELQDPMMMMMMMATADQKGERKKVADPMGKSKVELEMMQPKIENANRRNDEKTDEVVDELRPISKAFPIYPRRALMRGIEGHVVLEFCVTEQGKVRDPVVVEAEPLRVFNREAINAALKYKYKPKVVNQKPVEVCGVTNRISFEMRG